MDNQEKKHDMTDFMDDKNSSSVRVPDLDWLALTADNQGKNIPVPLNIEIVPQLQENWSRTTESSTNLIANQTRSELPSISDKISQESIRDVVYAAKRDMMKGITGKNLAKKLASTYPKNLLSAAGEELKKLATEQGLLGNVYIDISPFSSCEDAARSLGVNKVKLAKYVVGKPKGHVCSSHTAGFCKELRKNVVASMDYNDEVLKGYTSHLRMAGMIGPEDVIDSKDLLRSVFLRSAEEKKPTFVEPKQEKSPISCQEAESMEEDFKKLLIKEATEVDQNPELSKFLEVRPVLAFIQNEMLKGKIGNDLKESIQKKFTPDVIGKYASEIKKVASLQGLLGNIYVDVSYYKDVDEAVKSIRTASVSPSYIMQSYPSSKYDDTLQKVAYNTGCEILPRNGRISKKVANSYLDDLQFTKRISSDQASLSRVKIEAGENILGVLREAFLSSANYIPQVRVGGVQAHFHQGPARKYVLTGELKEATYRAVEAGLPMEKIESKLTQKVSTSEAVSMIRSVIASVKEIDANVLTKCAFEKYQFSSDVKMRKAAKCKDCIMCSSVGCTKHGLVFAKDESKKDDQKKDQPKDQKDKPTSNIDPKTEKVLLKENPDVVQAENINKEFGMEGYSDGNINVALDKNAFTGKAQHRN